MGDSVNLALGIIATVMLAVCLLPQLWRMFRTKSADDIAYGWTFIYAIGLIFYFVYLFREGAVVGYIGIAIEFAEVCVIIGYKYYLENYYLKRHPKGGSIGNENDKSTQITDMQYVDPSADLEGGGMRRISRDSTEQHGVTRIHHDSRTNVIP